MLCKARGLDPWVGDAFLVGFDSDDGPQFSLITAVQALFKRAELNPKYQGHESGVIVKAKGDKEAAPLERPGAMVYDNEALLGGWCKVHVEGHKVPTYSAINLTARDKGRSTWKKDKAGMIEKCAQASSLRRAFPSQCGGLYTGDELGDAADFSEAARVMAKEADAAAAQEAQKPPTATEQTMANITAELKQRQQAAQEEPLPEDLSKPPEGQTDEEQKAAAAQSLDEEMERHPPYCTDEGFDLKP